MSEGYDHHPQVLAAGWHGGQLFLLFLRISRRYKLAGVLAPKYLDVDFIRRYWGCPDDFPIKAATAATVASGLTRIELDGSIVIDGWDRWARPPDATATERSQRFRATQRSATAATCRGEEKRGEEKREEEASSASADDPQTAAHTGTKPPKAQVDQKRREKTPRQRDVESVYAAWRQTLGKPDLPPGKEWFSIVGGRLVDGATVEQLCLVPQGAKLDPWPGRRQQDGPQFLFGSMSCVSKFLDLAAKGPASDAKRGYVDPDNWNRKEHG